MNKIIILIPLIIYLVIMLYIAYKVNELKQDHNNFIEEYFIGNRSMGGFVLAMTLIATYASASSFIGGPGAAYKNGLSWVLLASIQIPTAFLTLGILGKKLAIISRKIKGVTIVEILKHRYNNSFVVITSSISTLIFFVASIIAQFVGGARLFETITGVDYQIGLLIFGVVVIIYTSLGGFRAVAITDAIQGIVMMISIIVLFIFMLKNGGGMANIMTSISQSNPDLLKPDSGGNLSQPFMLSFWILIGIGVLGLPQTAVRCMGFRDSKSLHRSMVISTFVIGFIMIGIHLIGVMGIAIIPGVEESDKIIPLLSLKVLPPILVGVFIGGPLAATMSTVDSMLILSSATIVKDLYINYVNPNISSKKIKNITFFTTLILGIIVFIGAFNPPQLLVWINLFAFGGLEATFFVPLILGLYWKKANKLGAIFSIISGLGSYLYFTIQKTSFGGVHVIVPTLVISILTFIIGTYIGQYKFKNDENVDQIFFK